MAKRIIVDKELEKKLEKYREKVFNEVANEIRSARVTAGMSQRQLAAGMNTKSHMPLLKAESGTNVQLSTLADIAYALGKRVRLVFE